MSNGLAVCLNSSFLGFYAHSGFMQGLAELGFIPEAVSGASAGALVAGLLGSGRSAQEVAALLLQFDLRRTLLDFGTPWRALGTCANLPGFTGPVSLDGALRLLREHLGDLRIEDCRQPRVAVSVTNMTTARSEIATSGPLAELILASGAAPAVFEARHIGDSVYLDGGIANAVPFDHWIDDPSIHTILVHSVVNPKETKVRQRNRPLTIAGSFNLSHQIICDELLRWKTEAARRAGKRLHFLRTEAPRPGLFSAHRLSLQCAAAGRATAEANRALLSELLT